MLTTEDKRIKFEKHYRDKAARVPDKMRKLILEEGWIDTVVNIQEENTPMSILFDTYMLHVNRVQDMDDFDCQVCRQRVIDEWRIIKPFLIELENAD